MLPPRLWVPVDGRLVEYATAAAIARDLGPDVTPAMVRRYAQRSGLPAYRVGRTAYYPADAAAACERDARLSGRGRPRSGVAA